MTSYMTMPFEDVKFILAGLRMYSDTLAECVDDPNLSVEEMLNFEADSKYVEGLIEDIEQFIADIEAAQKIDTIEDMRREEYKNLVWPNEP